MKPFNKIAIVGVGLIGGSAGLAARKKRLARRVVGIFHHRSTMNRALRSGAITQGSMDLASGVRGADLVLVASPVSSIPRLARQALIAAGKNAIVIDAGSTKGWVVSEIEKVAGQGSGAKFVGSHPMAGSEHAGVEFARNDLFDGAPCIVTKTRKTDERAIKIVTRFWAGLGARVNVMTPDEHDRVVALVSHLPHIVAYSLAGSVPGGSIRHSAEGFRDTTRVASSDPKLWADIFMTNTPEVIKACRMFEKYYHSIVMAISGNDRSGLIRLLESAKAKRDRYIDAG